MPFSLAGNTQVTLAPYSGINRASTQAEGSRKRGGLKLMLENASGGAGLLVRAEPLEWAEEISQRMLDEVRIVDGALLLDADPTWDGAINTMLVMKGVRVNGQKRLTLAKADVQQGAA